MMMCGLVRKVLASNLQNKDREKQVEIVQELVVESKTFVHTSQLFSRAISQQDETLVTGTGGGGGGGGRDKISDSGHAVD